MPGSAVHHAVDVAASPEACWKVLTDFNTWPRWFPRLKWASVVGDAQGHSDPWRVGGRFEMVLDLGIAVSLRPTVEEVDRPQRVRWVGKTWGLTGDHAYTLETHAAGLTRVTSHEKFSGVGARILTGPILAKLDEEAHRSLARFKELVEARA